MRRWTPTHTGPVGGVPVRPRRTHAPINHQMGDRLAVAHFSSGRPDTSLRHPHAGQARRSRGRRNLGCRGRGPGSAPARAGPERHWRERRGPPASGGLGNRGAIRTRLFCTDREHGGTQAVSCRAGSPREPWSEGSKVLVPQNRQPVELSADDGRLPEPASSLAPGPVGRRLSHRKVLDPRIDLH